ncbi:hypothetical protein IWW50_000958 [Coemansia erecta]|nr:hypothetical protein IWW50_000958 [Coemansia erecta]
MCKEQLADSYDMFVKVDDDVLYDPEHITDVIAHMDIAEHSLLGFLRLDKTVVWPSGPIYAYTSNTLRSLCSNKKAIGRTGGMHEDLRFGHALSLISQLKHYNMDNLIDAIHLQYRSSRMFVQFMQYGKCAN